MPNRSDPGDTRLLERRDRVVTKTTISKASPDRFLIGAGVRRIEAISGKAVENFMNRQFNLISAISEKLKNPKQ